VAKCCAGMRCPSARIKASQKEPRKEAKVEDKEQTNHVLATCGLNDCSARFGNFSDHSNPLLVLNIPG
jgi:hypothetical protein